jgi:hypothetical protein
MTARWVRTGFIVLWILFSLFVLAAGAIQMRSHFASTRAVAGDGDWFGNPAAVTTCDLPPCAKRT